MKRVHLTDSPAQWFDMEAAELFKEATYHNGSNHISKETGSQWNHVYLYKTAGGNWIKNIWSNMQGSSESYQKISKEDAAEFLLRNGYYEEAEKVVPNIVEEHEIK
jgi:hypothetical protein